jgi:hypothetical protein
VSRNSLIPENSMIASNFRRISSCGIPMIEPWRNTFSRPVRSPWKPAEISMSDPIRPSTWMLPGRRAKNSGQDLEGGRFARAVTADDAERLAGAHLEGEVAERPELIGPEHVGRVAVAAEPDQTAADCREQIPEAVMELAAPEPLGDTLGRDESRASVAHTYSANANSARWKSTAATESPPNAQATE